MKELNNRIYVPGVIKNCNSCFQFDFDEEFGESRFGRRTGFVRTWKTIKGNHHKLV